MHAILHVFLITTHGFEGGKKIETLIGKSFA
jgi:hypothetical protein